MLLPSAKRLIQPQNLHRSPIRSRGRCGLNLSTKRLIAPRRILPAAAPSAYLYDIIKELGLTTNLNLCLDAADPRSYDGVSQTWTDIIGGNNYFRGATSSSESTDPTFNGTAGNPGAGTYFSFDGGDHFNETSAQTFADNWHKNNGACSMVCVCWPKSSKAVQSGIWSNRGPLASSPGIVWENNGSQKLTFRHSTADATSEALTTTAVMTGDSYNFAGSSWDEATTTLLSQINGTAESVAGTASTATAANANVNVIGSETGATDRWFENTERIVGLLLWSQALTANALTSFYTEVRSRRSGLNIP
jgi:hypothetical protein